MTKLSAKRQQQQQPSHQYTVRLGVICQPLNDVRARVYISDGTNSRREMEERHAESGEEGKKEGRRKDGRLLLAFEKQPDTVGSGF